MQTSSELITYLKSPIFYNSERVQQNGVWRSFMSLRIEAAFAEKYRSNSLIFLIVFGARVDNKRIICNNLVMELVQEGASFRLRSVIKMC